MNAENVTEHIALDEKYPKVDGLRWYQRRRNHNALLLMLIYVAVAFFRGNLSIAIVAMTTPHNVTLPDGTIKQVADFVIDSKLKGYALSANIYIFMVNLIGGSLIMRYGVRWVIILGLLFSSFINIILPFLIQINIYLLLILRILDGIGWGLLYPSNVGMWVHWAPLNERGRLISCTHFGAGFGIMLILTIGGIFCEYFGWKSTFLLTGIFGLFLSILSYFLIFSKPEDDVHITKNERIFLKTHIPPIAHGKTIKHPWKKMALSLPCWANVITHFIQFGTFYTFVTQLPTFLNDVFRFDIKEIGFLSGLPFLFMTSSTIFSSYISDYIIKKKIFSVGTVRKMHVFIGSFGQAFCCILVYYINNPYGVIACVSVSMLFHSFGMLGFMVNWLDIALPHACILSGISNAFGMSSGAIIPIVTGYIVTDQSFAQWMIIFWILAGLNFFGSIFYCIFASGKEQKWVVKA